MQRIIQIVVTSVIPFLISCGSEQPRVESKIEPQRTQESSWSVRLTSQCSVERIEMCRGGFGFTVDSDGLYWVGPNFQGQVISGRVEGEEFKVLQGHLRALSFPNGSAAAGAEEVSLQCVPVEAAPSSPPQLPQSPPQSPQFKDSIHIRMAGSERVFVKTLEREFCFAGLPEPSAHAVHQALRELLVRYYPIPFPENTCDAAIARLEELYAQVQSCVTDIDCTYLSSRYAPIPRESLEFLTMSDGSKIRPLLVANRSLSQRIVQHLVSARDRAVDACQAVHEAMVCPGFGEFQTTQPPPACVEGTCRPHSRLAY